MASDPKSQRDAKDSSSSAAPVVMPEQGNKKFVQGSHEESSSFVLNNKLPVRTTGDTAIHDAAVDRLPPAIDKADPDLALFCHKPVKKSISEELWSQAYGELQETEPDLVALYEKIWEEAYTDTLGTAGDGGLDEEKRRRETVQAVADSVVHKLKTEDKIKESADGIMKVMNVVGDLITNAFVAATGAPLGPVTVLLKVCLPSEPIAEF